MREWMGPIFVGHFIFSPELLVHVHFGCSDTLTCFRFRLYITDPHCLALVLLLIVVPSGRCTVFLLVCVLYLLVSVVFFEAMLIRSIFLSLLLVHRCPLCCLPPIQGSILFPSGCIYVK